MGIEAYGPVDLAQLVGCYYQRVKLALQQDSRLMPRGMKFDTADNLDLHYGMKSEIEGCTIPEKHVVITVRDGIITRCVVLPGKLYVPSSKSEVK